MAANSKQPHHEQRENIAGLARASRLKPFEDLSLVGEFASRFHGAGGPDDVFVNVSMNTVIAFAVEKKEREEFRERFNDLWHKLQTEKK